jgi:predicted lipoprotein with Yx(FWY)xxD motif
MHSTGNRLAVSLAGLGVLALAAACGSGPSTAGGSQYGAPVGNAAGSGQGGTNSSTVSVQTVNGASVLVNQAGVALYSNDQDKTGKLQCVSSDCTAIWTPLTVPAGGQPTAASGVTGKLATVQRPDGTSQVTLDGKPLYTFSFDHGSGKVTGNGTQDSFGGTSFTWHSVTASGGGQAPATAAPPAYPGGY